MINLWSTGNARSRQIFLWRRFVHHMLSHRRLHFSLPLTLGSFVTHSPTFWLEGESGKRARALQRQWKCAAKPGRILILKNKFKYKLDNKFEGSAA